MRRAIRPAQVGRKATTMSNITVIRTALRNEFGARQYRITKTGDIHVNGTMPNTNQTGWYLYGNVNRAETRLALGV